MHQRVLHKDGQRVLCGGILWFYESGYEGSMSFGCTTQYVVETCEALGNRFITGHSLGAAVGTLAMCTLKLGVASVEGLDRWGSGLPLLSKPESLRRIAFHILPIAHGFAARVLQRVVGSTRNAVSGLRC